MKTLLDVKIPSSTSEGKEIYVYFRENDKIGKKGETKGDILKVSIGRYENNSFRKKYQGPIEFPRIESNKVNKIFQFDSLILISYDRDKLFFFTQLDEGVPEMEVILGLNFETYQQENKVEQVELWNLGEGTRGLAVLTTSNIFVVKIEGGMFSTINGEEEGDKDLRVIGYTKIPHSIIRGTEDQSLPLKIFTLPDENKSEIFVVTLTNGILELQRFMISNDYLILMDMVDEFEDPNMTLFLVKEGEVPEVEEENPELENKEKQERKRRKEELAKIKKELKKLSRIAEADEEKITQLEIQKRAIILERTTKDDESDFGDEGAQGKFHLILQSSSGTLYELDPKDGRIDIIGHEAPIKEFLVLTDVHNFNYLDHNNVLVQSTSRDFPQYYQRPEGLRTVCNPEVDMFVEFDTENVTIHSLKGFPRISNPLSFEWRN